MKKLINILMVFFIIFFIFSIFKYYFSNMNVNNKSFNRLNIDQILQEKIKDLPILVNDTNNVIEFNNSINEEINDEKKRKFWDLLKIK
tara:strand:- start:597 stop:860 length:264 start_codon:yes stop_codon:yes gene_type:complete